MVTESNLKSGKCEYSLTVLSIIDETDILSGNTRAIKNCRDGVVYVYSSFGWGGCSLLQYIKV